MASEGDEPPDADIERLEEEPDEGEPGEHEPFEATARETREIAGEAARKRSDFLGLMGHLYRGAMSRSTTWRTRLDRTSNWSVVIVATLLTWAFSTAENPHSIILLGIVVVSLFLVIEARRYRMYDVWRSRVRILEENVFANALEPRGVEQREWRRLLSEDLRRPAVKISVQEALGRRLRRIYLALLLILLLAWVVRLAMLGGAAKHLVLAATIWVIPGEAVVGIVGGYYAVMLLLALWPQKREAKGKLRDPEQSYSFKKDHEG